MPIFEYEPDQDDGGCDACRGRFEVFQGIHEPPLSECPACGRPCHRVFSAFAVGGKEKGLLNPKNLAAKGFTQYTRKGKGYYEKTAGKGPDSIADGSS